MLFRSSLYSWRGQQLGPKADRLLSYLRRQLPRIGVDGRCGKTNRGRWVGLSSMALVDRNSTSGLVAMSGIQDDGQFARLASFLNYRHTTGSFWSHEGLSASGDFER